MAENMREIESVLAAMTQGVTEDLDPGQEIDQEIMIITGFISCVFHFLVCTQMRMSAK